MKIDINKFIAFEKLTEEVNSVMDIVNDKGEVIIIKDNKPTYLIKRIETILENGEVNVHVASTNENITLHQAMKIVLLEADNQIMHARDLSDEIYKRRLYLKKDGMKAHYTQIRARCNNYPRMFKAYSENRIKYIGDKDE